MKVVVITGSSRGIGLGLADSFLARGCAVVVSSRSQERVEQAVAVLAARYPAASILARACDVTDVDQVQALWEAAREHFGRIDIWINNAGVANPQRKFWEHPAERVRAVVETNILGAYYGSQVALRGMLAQGFGALYNLEGLGSDGRQVEGLALYGSTKAALRYLDVALAVETQGTPVIVGALSPGMVVTDLLTAQYDDRPEGFERAKRIFNILADRVETVTPWLAERVLANQKNGARLRYLTPLKSMSRFMLAPFCKRDLFAD